MPKTLNDQSTITTKVSARHVHGTRVKKSINIANHMYSLPARV